MDFPENDLRTVLKKTVNKKSCPFFDLSYPPDARFCPSPKTGVMLLTIPEEWLREHASRFGAGMKSAPFQNWKKGKQNQPMYHYQLKNNQNGRNFGKLF
jgi:hypothetical protein